jgi:ubiquinone/menaquinone biosynthesis C-methylase UbiE
MGKLRNFVTPLHQATKRDYLARMVDDKVQCMKIAKQYGQEYWDGDRRYGYGGYNYIPSRWKSVAKELIETYKLGPGSKILDVGCGKGYLLHEMLLIEPKLLVTGIDISKHAINCATEIVKPNLLIQPAQAKYQFKNKYFDLVISLTTLHNLNIYDLWNALQEIERVGNEAYVLVESYRNEKELFNLQCWALTCESFFDNEEWRWIFEKIGFKGDYEFIYFE